MNSDESQEASPDVLAAEYVLGTLDGEERTQVEALIASDPDFAARVGQWERQLGELHALAGGIEPPPAVWDAIKAKLPETPQTTPLRLPELARGANGLDLVARLSRFRLVAAVNGTMAAMLALFIVTSAVAPTILPDALRPRPRVIVQMAEGPPPPPRYVAVLQRDATAPAFIVTVDIAAGSLTVRRVTAEREPGKSYELWLVSNQFPAPRPLGLVGGGEFTQMANLAPYDPATISDASFAVSIEPEGGSPSGAPSNVTFAGKLVESVPLQPR